METYVPYPISQLHRGKSCEPVEMKPCPFCGGNELKVSTELTTEEVAYYDERLPFALKGTLSVFDFLCRCGCRLTVKTRTLREGIAIWNRRTSDECGECKSLL